MQTTRMKTPSDRLRRAALAPTPARQARHASAWCATGGAWHYVHIVKLGPRAYSTEFAMGTDTERRMFLLFVAEAIE